MPILFWLLVVAVTTVVVGAAGVTVVTVGDDLCLLLLEDCFTPQIQMTTQHEMITHSPSKPPITMPTIPPTRRAET